MTTPDKKRSTWGNLPSLEEVIAGIDWNQLPVEDNGEFFIKSQVARKSEGIVAIPPHQPSSDEIESWHKFGSIEQIKAFRLADQWLEPYFSLVRNSPELLEDYYLLYGHPFQQS